MTPYAYLRYVLKKSKSCSVFSSNCLFIYCTVLIPYFLKAQNCIGLKGHLITKAYFTSLLRLPYEHYFEKIAQFYRAAARPPYEIVKPYRRITFSRHVYFCCKIRTIFGPKDSHKTTARQIHYDFSCSCQLNVK